MSNARTVAVVFGTRPEALKLAPLVTRLSANPEFNLHVINTGQHDDMVEEVIDLFGLPVHQQPNVLRCGQSLADLSARLLIACDRALARAAPDLVVVQGDTATTVMSAWAAFNRHIPIAHVEAGLRTGCLEAPFPEEANRRVVATLATWNFAPTPGAVSNLRFQGVAADRIWLTGNTSIDVLMVEVAAQADPASGARQEAEAALSVVLGAEWRAKPIVIITAHRRESAKAGFDGIAAAVSALARRFTDHRFVYILHPNPMTQEPARTALTRFPNITLTPSLGYRPFVALLQESRIVVTDSGGLQEEAPALGKPVFVLRDATERPEGVAAGVAELVGTRRETIVDRVSRILADERIYAERAKVSSVYGDGLASARIEAALGTPDLFRRSVG